MLTKIMKSEKGASAVIIALSLFVLVGFAAIAIDLAVGFNQRRQDQTAADVGVMAGAVESLGSSADIRDQILDFTQRNVIGTYSDWQAKWEGCADPERLTLNSNGFAFNPVPAPAGWGVATLDCISMDPAGFVRVQLPQLEFTTTFGRVLGVDELSTSADAIARMNNRGGGGILPFGLLATAGEGQHVCLRDNSAGLALPPCDGPSSGNFGAIEAPHYGSMPNGPSQNCNGAPKSDVLAVNIALGLDHRVVPDPDGVGANEIRDTCTQMDAGNTPDTLNTFQGLSNGLEEGIATGPVPGGYTPRLQGGTNAKRSVYGNQLDDRPLWEYIDPNLMASDPLTDIPQICEASTFDNSNPAPLVDWDGDGTDDAHESWQHMSACLEEFANGNPISHPNPYTTPIFYGAEGDPISVGDSVRFAYVPQFHESTWPSGNGWRHILRFKATWIQGTWWKKGNTTNAFHPGEPGTFNAGGNWQLRQLSGMLIPDASLPTELRGDPPPSGGLNPFVPELFR